MNLEQHVYKKLMNVPKGHVTTYGDLAKAVGLKNGQRVIGKIMNKNPYPVLVPCLMIYLFYLPRIYINHFLLNNKADRCR